MHLFITGTDTDAGKTYVTCLILEALRAREEKATGFKPFCCGSREDVAAIYTSSTAGLSMDEINPVWLKNPASPYAAALIENRQLPFTDLRAQARALADIVPHVLLEGAGGWEVPLAPAYSLADFAQELGWPVLVVVNSRLGALNHTLLTLREIAARGLKNVGIILNHPQAERDAASISHGFILSRMTDVPVLGEVMHGETDGESLLEAIESRVASLA